jgi:hypothetical protein
MQCTAAGSGMNARVPLCAARCQLGAAAERPQKSEAAQFAVPPEVQAVPRTLR